MLNRAREWWEGLSRNNQIILVTSSLGGLIALIGFIAWASTPEYVPLFSNLSAQDANAIVEKLKESNVPYRLSQNSTSIEVPTQNHDEMLMKLVSQGLPQQSASAVPGYELLEKANNFQTQPMEALMMQRAKEGEISKSIMTMQQIGNATVHFAAADDTPFTRDKQEAKASVILNLKPGQTLSEENVRAIVRLVQMSYTGLAEKNISVVDSHGDMLFDPVHAANGISDDLVKMQRQLGQAKRQELQMLLDNTIGPRKAVVLCNVELTSNNEQSEKTTYDAGPTITKTSAEEELNGQGTVRGQTPGLNANAGPATPQAGVSTYNSVNNDNGSYKRKETVQTTQPSETKTVTTRPAGRIERYTVSALVDTSVTPDQIAAITQVLKTNIGVDPNDPTRARDVTVAQVPFDHSNETADAKAAAAERSAENTQRLISILVPLGLMTLCLFLLARALRKPKMVLAGNGQLALAGGGSMNYPLDGPGQLVFGPDGLPLTGHAFGSPPGTTVDEHGNIIALPGTAAPKTFEVIEEAFDSNLESILHLTKSKPETVAMLIKSWVSEE